MKSIILYLMFVAFLLGTIPSRFIVNRLKKQGKIKEAEKVSISVLLRWANFTVKHAGVKLHVEGRENIPEGNCLFVSNHQGVLDIPVILCAINKAIGFIAKKELLKFKLVSSWAKENHCVFIDRSNIRESITAINEGAENLKNGYNMAIFPEGTRSRGHRMGKFKKGSLKLALKSNALVVPVTIDGTYKVVEANGWKVKPAHVNVVISKPIDVSDLTKEQQQNLSELIENTIESNLSKIINKQNS
ncbi:1-acyl-sn-glycerol-3-phosphate acyltransferase [Clostridium sp. DJ247]|uniref:lysophospholipid acyltransferase family protein n=1 Tax=Clostridium sp. DJ247 TaxID=2726188 RepID=UPI001628A245|nr:lysophospholipid acyltransferase family protein [Clostridium sp. DJ247]MBC2581017.1 1-acyl-sn-glycerol-3-phosphate acyltransferase [Clostridium sp. DJ247]